MKCSECGAVKPPALRPRELQALSLLAEGLEHPEVAGRMFIGLNTAYQYSKRIRAYFGASSTPEAVAKARLWGVI
ncbi:DNA-binding CsgD family transcriptional regulator [Lentzea atacamensis]|uniref:DNA-binding CsgD family transcriptional regulator n=1 Tax=Lentzea atacamensis TaxID=531938 RepID=A0A316HNQ1_9PSEU|nr:helix-turn-helix transcriptional regulator [Lentzea atacamensis]PWK81667.1 DNA-binding CsgD family transcriptional regulator [Lentzea atacamensis]